MSSTAIRICILAIILSAQGLQKPAFADQQNTPQAGLQDNSVESFFQIDTSSPPSTNVSSLKDEHTQIKRQNFLESSDSQKHERKGKLLYRILDNIGVPMPLSKIEALDPSLSLKEKSPASQKQTVIPNTTLERIQVPDQSASSEAANKIPDKIPKSELEGTMYDSTATPDEKKTAP